MPINDLRYILVESLKNITDTDKMLVQSIEATSDNRASLPREEKSLLYILRIFGSVESFFTIIKLGK